MSIRPTRWVLGTLALIAAHLTTRSGWAADPPRGPIEDAPARADAKEWYGAPMVVADVASVALIVGGLVAEDHRSKAAPGLLLVGAGAYLIGGPIVHVVQHRTRTGVASLALRGAAPLGGGLAGAIVGAAIGSRMNCGDNDNCAIGGLAIGFAVGVAAGGITAMVVDDVSLARREASHGAPWLAVTPTYQPANHQTGLALLGTW